MPLASPCCCCASTPRPASKTHYTPTNISRCSVSHKVTKLCAVLNRCKRWYEHGELHPKSSSNSDVVTQQKYHSPRRTSPWMELETCWTRVCVCVSRRTTTSSTRRRRTRLQTARTSSGKKKLPPRPKRRRATKKMGAKDSKPCCISYEDAVKRGKKQSLCVCTLRLF